jgi:Putative aminopeptidase
MHPAKPASRLLLFGVVFGALLARVAVAADAPAKSEFDDRRDLVSAVKHLEKKLGFRRTKNFRRDSAAPAVAYRCYYTGKLELPASYEKLKLVQGTKDGCPLDPRQYDIFFYPLQAVGNGKTPVSASLEHASVERFLFVVPHEDFHANKELRKLPATWGEASATLVGLLTAAEVARQKFGENSEVYRDLRREPELFNRKAEIVNGYFHRLRKLYAAARDGEISEDAALTQKEQIFAEIHEACSAISPDPKSFKRCLAADNNAGLAFDETYAKYYPTMYQLYLAEGRQLKPTVDALQRAISAPTDAEAWAKLQKAVKSGATEVMSGN